MEKRMVRFIIVLVACWLLFLACSASAAPNPSTPTPEPSHPTFAELLDAWNSPSLTKVQKAAVVDSFRAGRVTNWQGVVVDVNKILGSYYVWVDVPGGNDGRDVSLDVPQKEAVRYYKGQQISFSGKVASVSSFLGFSVTLKDVTTEFGPIPTPTSTPLPPTPKPTRTPTSTPLPTSTSTPTNTPLPPAMSLNEIWDVWRDTQRPEAERRAALENMRGREVRRWTGTICRISEPPVVIITADFPGGWICDDAQFQIAAGDRDRFHIGQEMRLATARIEQVNVSPDGPRIVLRDVSWELGVVPTPTITPTPTPSSTPTPAAVAKQAGNLRAAPNTKAKLLGAVRSGQVLNIVGCNDKGDWYQLEGGSWIYGELVANGPVPCYPAPTQTPVPTSIPTVPSCRDLMASRKTMTSAEWDDLQRRTEGWKVAGWAGTVESIGQGGMTLFTPGQQFSVHVDGGCSLLFVISDRAKAATYINKQRVLVSGFLDYYGGILGDLAVYLVADPEIVGAEAPKPVNLTFVQFIKNYVGMTDLQQAQYTSRIIDMRVHWTARVLEVRESGRVWLENPITANFLWVYLDGLPINVAQSINIGDRIDFEATVRATGTGLLGVGFAVYLDDPVLVPRR